jgi:ABC-type nickel/cobalt efflux system permease component RcnA
VAGGLLPSPTAVVVLLGAVGLGRPWFGVLLVLTFGLGMAATLTAAGLLVLRTRRHLERRRRTRGLPGPLATALDRLPVLTGTVVLVVGVVLTVRGLTGALGG